MVLGSACYAVYVASFVLAAGPLEFPSSTTFFFNSSFIKTMIIVSALINGFGAAILWVAQGKYISECAND